MPIFGADLVESLPDNDANIVDQKVDRSERRFGGQHGLGCLVGLCQVGLNGECAAAHCLDFRNDAVGGFLVGMEVNRDVRSCAGQAECQIAPRAVGGPGDQCGFSCQRRIVHEISPEVWRRSARRVAGSWVRI